MDRASQEPAKAEFKISRLALAISLGFVPQWALAQTAPTPAASEPIKTAQASPTPAANTPVANAPTAAAAAEDSLQLEKVFVTGTSTARTKMKQSVSVSTVSSEQIQNAKAASSAEILRTVPGLRAEATGGEGNANLGVRGLPMSDGGGRYVQLQETACLSY